MKRFTLLILTTCTILFSCEKLFIKPALENTPENNFNELWQQVDKNYSFFIYKNINWNKIYTKYHKKINNNMSEQELFDVMDDMLNELKDGHVNLTSPFDRTRYSEWYLNAPKNFDYDLLLRNYFKDEQKYTEYGGFQYIKFNEIGYVLVPSFSSGAVGYFNYVLNYFNNCKGIIIDVRSNGGGLPENAEKLAGYFTPSKKLYAYWQWRNGPNHNDFSEKIPYYIEPNKKTYINKPIVVLTNRSSFSATNDFVLMMKETPNTLIIGDTTGGGGGVPISKELPNGWTFRFSKTITLNANNKHVEFGIAPDIYITMDTTDAQNGIDSMLEKAIEVLD